jgi:surfactin synthase thioesterase subunit
MRLILLPAFDGTGKMFSDFVTALGDTVETQVISYPESGGQDYPALAGYIQTKIPDNEDYILLGESFAGPLVYDIASKDQKNCKAAIFVATYLTNPSPIALKTLTALPAGLISFFLSKPAIIAKLSLSKNADPSIAKAIADNFASVKSDIIKQRLMTINNLGEAPTESLSMPCLNLTATDDNLVMKEKINEFKALCAVLDIESAKGGHFVLQENPEQSAKLVNIFVNNLVDR